MAVLETSSYGRLPPGPRRRRGDLAEPPRLELANLLRRHRGVGLAGDRPHHCEHRGAHRVHGFASIQPVGAQLMKRRHRTLASLGQHRLHDDVCHGVDLLLRPGEVVLGVGLEDGVGGFVVGEA